MLSECTDDALVETFTELDSDHSRLDAMKEEALASAEVFYIDRYVDWLAAEILEMKKEIQR